MRRTLATLSLLAALAIACAPAMVKAPAPAPVPEGPVQDATLSPAPNPAANPEQPPAQVDSPAAAPADDAATPRLALDDPIPLDPAIVTGRLDNGLAYFVRRNAEPPDRVELRLVVNAGSVLEEDDQRGLAHFVEHMAFNGTRRFEGELVDYLEWIGMQLRRRSERLHQLRRDGLQLHVPTDARAARDAASTSSPTGPAGSCSSPRRWTRSAAW